MGLFSQAAFFTTVNHMKDLPLHGGKEVAFVGRSNAGKSSAINTLANHVRLAYTSKTPGRTQHLNYFSLGENNFLVDLPGYGFAKVSQNTRATWEKMIAGYLQHRPNLMTVFVLIDSRHEPQNIDLEFLRKLGAWGVPFNVIFTKADKSTQREAAKHAPDPEFKTLDGQSRKLSSLRGQIVVVNFWATWCAPCQEELPRLSQLAASYAGKPVSFVFISIDEPKNRAKIPATLARLHVALDSWVNADTDTLDRFGLGNIVPGTIVLDEDGTVVARVMGEAKEDDVHTAVDWLLGGKTGTAPPALAKRY